MKSNVKQRVVIGVAQVALFLTGMLFHEQIFAFFGYNK